MGRNGSVTRCVACGVARGAKRKETRETRGHKKADSCESAERREKGELAFAAKFVEFGANFATSRLALRFDCDAFAVSQHIGKAVPLVLGFICGKICYCGKAAEEIV